MLRCAGKGEVIVYKLLAKITFFGLLLITFVNHTALAKRVALVIGNGAYTQSSPLRNPVNDATDIATSLKAIGFEVDLQTDLDLPDMIEAARNFEDKIAADDIALFYYSGHGAQVDGVNYLIPTTANIESANEVSYEAFALNRLIDKLSDSQSKVNIIILDACRNNPFRGFRDGNTGLAPINDVQGQFLIAYATAPNDVAADGIGRNSPYTKHLKELIRQPNLNLLETFTKVASNVYKETNEEQQPWVSHFLVDEFAFVEGVNTGTTFENTDSQLTVTSEPSGAKVFLDEAYMGITPLPLSDSDIGAGSHKIRLELEGYQPYEQVLEANRALGVIGEGEEGEGQTIHAIMIFVGVVTNVDLENSRVNKGIVNTTADLVSKIERGGKVEIAAGRYVLEESLILTKDVELVGAGRDKTFIVSKADDFGIGFEGSGSFKAQGLTFDYRGKKPSTILWVHDGQVDINDCAFRGGVESKKSKNIRIIAASRQSYLGHGLYLTGETTGEIKESIFEANSSNGIAMLDQVQIVIKQSTINNNFGSGIAYFGNVQGEAINNTVEGNGVSGIVIFDEAQPKLGQNTISNNSYYGISYNRNSGGMAMGNTIEGNSLHGIQVKDESQPRLEQNNISNNNNSGIYFFGIYGKNVGGTVIANTIEGNRGHGIELRYQAEPKLENNNLSSNEGYGIYIHSNNSLNPQINNNTFNGNKEGEINN